MRVAATVGGVTVRVDEVDDREAALRARIPASALPRPDTGEGRQLRRWLTQLLVTERVVAAEAAARGLTAADPPDESDILPDNASRLDIGSVAAAVLADPLARALFADVTAGVAVTAADVADYHARNPMRFAAAVADQSVISARSRSRGERERAEIAEGCWHDRTTVPALPEVHRLIEAHLCAAVRRREFRRWLDARCADVVRLAPGYEHPGDPRQPDNVHRH